MSSNSDNLLPIEIIQLLLAHCSFTDALRAKRVSIQWRDASTILFRRGANQKKTTDEKVKFAMYKHQRLPKRQEEKEITKEEGYEEPIWDCALDSSTLISSGESMRPHVMSTFLKLILFAEEESSIWDYLLGVFRKSGKIDFKSDVTPVYLEIRNASFASRTVKILHNVLYKYECVNIEVDPNHGGSPENCPNLVKVAKEYIDSILIEIGNLPKSIIGLLQYVGNMERSILPMKVLLFSELEKGTRNMVQKCLLVRDVLSWSIFGNVPKEPWYQGLVPFCEETAKIMDETVMKLKEIKVESVEPLALESKEVDDLLFHFDWEWIHY